MAKQIGHWRRTVRATTRRLAFRRMFIPPRLYSFIVGGKLTVLAARHSLRRGGRRRMITVIAEPFQRSALFFGKQVLRQKASDEELSDIGIAGQFLLWSSSQANVQGGLGMGSRSRNVALWWTTMLGEGSVINYLFMMLPFFYFFFSTCRYMSLTVIYHPYSSPPDHPSSEKLSLQFSFWVPFMHFIIIIMQ